jgi:type II secretory pathway pseudopilin PulG
MMVIAVTVTAITPPIFVAVATRVQNQRSEQAQQIAQQEIDRVRLLLESGNYQINDLPPVASSGPLTSVGGPTTAPAKNQSLGVRSAYNGSAQAAFLLDLNNDGQEDFLVQTYRDGGVYSSKTPTVPLAFRMAVRVYAATARQNLGNLKTDMAAIKFTTGEGQQVNRPLAVVYSVVSRSETNDALPLQCQLLSSNPANCPSP